MDDALIVASHWGDVGTAVWSSGDFNGDRNVNAVDAAIMAANWSFATPENGGTTVPEPTMLASLIGIALLVSCMRRGRFPFDRG